MNDKPKKHKPAKKGFKGYKSKGAPVKGGTPNTGHKETPKQPSRGSSMVMAHSNHPVSKAWAGQLGVTQKKK
jgi:hypothetical protein